MPLGDRRSLFRGWMHFVDLCLSLVCPSTYPKAPIRRGKVLCVNPAPQSTSAAPLLMRSLSGFSGTFVWVPIWDHGINLLILKSKKCWEMSGQDQLNNLWVAEGSFLCLEELFLLRAAWETPCFFCMQKQSASFTAVEADVWLEACQETKNSFSNALPLVSQVNVSSWWTLISLLALK